MAAVRYDPITVKRAKAEFGGVCYTDEYFRCLVALRLGVPLGVLHGECCPAKCTKRDGAKDTLGIYGSHCLFCKGSSQGAGIVQTLYDRHNRVSNVLVTGLQKAQAPVRREVGVEGDKLRPGDVATEASVLGRTEDVDKDTRRLHVDVTAVAMEARSNLKKVMLKREAKSKEKQELAEKVKVAMQAPNAWIKGGEGLSEIAGKMFECMAEEVVEEKMKKYEHLWSKELHVFLPAPFGVFGYAGEALTRLLQGIAFRMEVLGRGSYDVELRDLRREIVRSCWRVNVKAVVARLKAAGSRLSKCQDVSDLSG